MKPIFLLTSLLFLCFSLVSHAQDYEALKNIKLKDQSDCQKAEEKVVECSTYLLSTPLEKNNIDRLYSVQFLMRWMEATPDYTFDLDETVTKISKSNNDILSIYLASMAKFVLENKDKSKDPKEVKFNSIVTLLNYCEAASNKVALNSELKKMIKAKSENKLKEYLKL